MAIVKLKLRLRLRLKAAGAITDFGKEVLLYNFD
jgi:hypothetical protein